MKHWIQHLRDNDNSAYLIYFLLLLVLAADSRTQLGFAHGFLYAPLLLLSGLVNKPSVLTTTLTLSLLFIAVGYALSPAAPAGFATVYVLANRGGAAICLLLIYLQMRSVNQLEERQSQQQLALQQQQQQLLLTSHLARFGSWSLDMHSKMLSLTPEALQLLPTAQPQMTLSQFCQLFQAEYRPALRQALTDGVEQDQAFDLECPAIDGNALQWLRIIGCPSEQSSNQLAGILQDTNSEHQNKIRLALEQQRFRRLADSMPIVVWSASPDGEVNFINQALAEYCGKDSDWLVSHWLEMLHAQDRERVIQQWQHCVSSGDPYNTEFRIRRYDGAYFWYLTKAVPEYEPDGSISKWLGSAMLLQQHQSAAS